MFINKLKQFKESLTQSNSQSSHNDKQKPKKADDINKERFGGMTKEQMRRMEEGSGTSLARAKISEDAQKSLATKPLVPEEKVKTEDALVSVVEEDTMNDGLESLMAGSLSKPVVEAKLTSTIDEYKGVEAKEASAKKEELKQVEPVTTVTKSKDKYPLTPDGVMFAQTVATNYSQGEVQESILLLRNYLNQHKGAVHQKFWYMLMDTYQIINNKVDFEKTALAFAQLFDTSPPSWIEQKDNKKSVMAGKNILILDPVFTIEQVAKFKDFFKAAKHDKFCRINVNQCKFELSDMEALKELYKLFLQLRKSRIKSFLMGESTLNNFCKSYMNFEPKNKGLKKVFMDNEAFFWNLYLEILQWKGKEEEFEEIAFQFAEKFEISPNGWEPDGVMSFDTDEVVDDKPQLDKELNNTNVNTITDILKYDFATKNKAELDFTNVDRVDFSTCGSISHLVQDFLTKTNNQDKDIYLVRPNEMILTLFEMLGTNENFKVVPKKR